MSFSLERTRSGIVVLALSLSALSESAAGAGLTCRAEVDRQQVAPGENVVLTLHATYAGTQAPQYDPPVIPGVEVITGGSRQNISMDGSGSRIAITGIYYLRSQSGADFQIPAITFHAGQNQCSTKAIAISVEKSVTGLSTGTTQPRADRHTGQTAHREAGQPGDPAYITLEVDRTEAWVGQQIILTFRYHRLRNTWGQPSYTAPRTEGFWRLDLPPERSFRQAAAGQIYDVTEIRYALFPTRGGELIIEPARLVLAADPFGRFFGRGGGQQQLLTDSMTISVKDWPSPHPPGFSGIAASRLDFVARLDRHKVPRGEPATLSLQVSADAFLKGFKGPAVPEQPGMRLFDAAETLSEETTGPRYRAIFTQEKAIVPVTEGTLSLPPLELVYFNTDEGSYRTVQAATPALLVTPSDLPVAGDDPSGFRRAEIARIGHDLAFIHPAAGPLRRQASPLVHQVIWWLLFLAPWCLLCGYRWWLRRQALAERDPAGRRRQRAWIQAKRSLRYLSRHGGEPAALTQAILGFVADHLNRSSAGLTTAEVQAWCAELHQAKAGQKLAVILANSDQVRFGGLGSVDIAAMASEAMDLLASLQHTIEAGQRSPRGKAKRPLHGLVILPCGMFLALAPAMGFDAWAAASGPDPARLLAEGNQAYTAGDFDTAQRLYQDALDRGGDDAVLHYNLGNTLARRGELGRAIASYLRAQRLAPRDRDIRANLAWVRTNTRDLELAGNDLPPVVNQLDAAVHLLALDEWALLLIVLSWLTVLFVAWIWRRGGLSTGWRRGRLFLTTLTMLTAVAVTTRWYSEVVRDVAVVVAEQVAVCSGPGDSFPIIFRVHDGLTLEIRGERDGWARIGLGGDWVGWVPAHALERVRRQ